MNEILILWGCVGVWAYCLTRVLWTLPHDCIARRYANGIVSMLVYGVVQGLGILAAITLNAQP